MPDRFLERLTERGWTRVASRPSSLQPPSRCAPIPDELLRFIASFDVLCSADETQWFLSIADYHRREEGFSWDEFESMSLEAAAGDVQWQQAITSFWNAHLPVFMRVDGEYAFAAYCCAGENAGHYVSGREPEFEEVSVIGRNLAEFQAWVLDETAA